MWSRTSGSDVESGEKPLLSNMILEGSEIRWAFIRKVYSIVLFQLLATAAVSAVVVFVRPVSAFFVGTTAGLAVYVALIASVFLVLFPMYYFRKRHPINYLLLGIFTICLSFSIGLTCAFTSGRIILEAVILTALVVLSLTLYTFWAAKRGHDFSFLGPFLSSALTVLIIFGIIQIFFPFDKISVMIYGFLSAIVFCGYIVFDTDNLIKRYSYDEYIWASVSLYLDIVNLFLSFISIFGASER
ncbi:protein LIFEGUARD 4-like [Punica granatum]|uniref:Uncharacterized protein n=2 Tax=Punica granatum TaxID=22663 RepID=A0A218W2K0_PUNGR|nr:protein LIFEGUARD 4-like [Punica granatum]OWM66866.1 hypothetical protein CDL15_Pgr002661 [Punica granatum]PKI43196.1 hypothetical protein CRG98_036421 [Punica granatum]